MAVGGSIEGSRSGRMKGENAEERKKWLFIYHPLERLFDMTTGYNGKSV